MALLFALGCGAEVGEPWLDEGFDVTHSEHELKNGYVMANGAPLGGVVRVEVWDYSANRWRSCTGQILSRKSLLTAAHCLTEAGMQSSSGSWPVRVTKQIANGSFLAVTNSWVSAQVAVHQAFINQSKHEHDVAVVTTPLTWQNVSQAHAALIAKGTHSGSAWLVGYGNHDTGYNDYDGQLRAKQGYVTYSANNREYTNSATGSDPWLCIGDSGGPLLTTAANAPLAWGVASYITNATGYCGKSGHWAPTVLNWSWIASKVGGCQDQLSFISCW